MKRITHADLTPWEVLEERPVYTAEPWLGVFVQRVKLPDGSIIDDYHRVRFPDYVTVAAATTDGHFVMVRKYTHGFEKVATGLPGGLTEKEETPLRSAQRELPEETRISADEWTSLGTYMPHSNYGCGRTHFFLANHATQTASPESGDLEEMEVILMTKDDIRTAVTDGEIVSMSTVSLLALVLNPGFLLAEEQ